MCYSTLTIAELFAEACPVLGHRQELSQNGAAVREEGWDLGQELEVQYRPGNILLRQGTLKVQYCTDWIVQFCLDRAMRYSPFKYRTVRFNRCGTGERFLTWNTNLKRALTFR